MADEMNKTGEKLAFIVGHYKSGSTWLSNLLSLHPDLRGVAETHVFRYTEPGADLARCMDQLFHHVAWAEGGWRRLPRYCIAEWSRPLRRALGLARGQSTLRVQERPMTMLDLPIWDLLSLRQSLSRCRDGDEYCRLFFGFLVKKLEPGRYLVEKTPTNMPYVPRIRALFPRAKLLAVYRDGRDVVVSDQYHLARTYGATMSFADRVIRWRDAMEAQFRCEAAHDVHTLSYEALLERPREVVPAIFDHLALPLDEARLDDMLSRSSFEFVTGRRPGQGDEKAFYRKGIAGDWRNTFTEDEKRSFSQLAGDVLVRLGYERDADWRTWS